MSNLVEELEGVVSDLLKHSKSLADQIRTLNVPEVVGADGDRDAEGFDDLLREHDDLVARVENILTDLQGQTDGPDRGFGELDEWRRIAAEDVYVQFDFGSYEAEDSSGWEYVSGGDEWTLTVFVLPRDAKPGADTLKSTLTVRFEPGTDTVEHCSVLVNGSEIIEDTAGLSSETKAPSM